MKGCTGGLGNGRAPGGWLGGGIASRKLIAVIKDIWLPNHAKKVYLAQRHSQEFSCEPNFGGCPPPPPWLRQWAVGGIFITGLLQIYRGIFQSKNCVNRLRSDRIMAMSLWPIFYPTLYLHRKHHTSLRQTSVAYCSHRAHLRSACDVS